MEFNVFDEKGNKVTCDVIGMFVHDNKNFIIYTDNNALDSEKDVYASLYKLEGNNIVLLPITNESDWDLVDKYLEDV